MRASLIKSSPHDLYIMTKIMAEEMDTMEEIMVVEVVEEIVEEVVEVVTKVRRF